MQNTLYTKSTATHSRTAGQHEEITAAQLSVAVALGNRPRAGTAACRDGRARGGPRTGIRSE